MNLCSSGHDEICYEGRNCPVCVLISEKVEKVNVEEIIKIITKVMDAEFTDSGHSGEIAEAIVASILGKE